MSTEPKIVGYCRTCGKALDEASVRATQGAIFCEQHAAAPASRKRLDRRAGEPCARDATTAVSRWGPYASSAVSDPTSPYASPYTAPYVTQDARRRFLTGIVPLGSRVCSA